MCMENLDFVGNFRTYLFPVPGAHLMKPGIVDNLNAGVGSIPIQDTHGPHEDFTHIFAERNILQKDRLCTNAWSGIFVAASWLRTITRFTTTPAFGLKSFI